MIFVLNFLGTAHNSRSPEASSMVLGENGEDTVTYIYKIYVRNLLVNTQEYNNQYCAFGYTSKLRETPEASNTTLN
uniref:Uncharacterized protein n=1 Tax=Mimivirus LCMiAC01 TaxID=2506608 RepID=A0A481Z0D6_9VIRU|nr:MAG: hypothetical protein LCMiAC01_05710 [Mimivirus LCMiAC01]